MPDRAVNWQLWLGLALTLLCTFLLVHNIDLAAVTTALAQANYVLLLPAGAFYSLALWLKVVRWRQLFPSENRIHDGHLFAALMVSYMGNTVLPARAGELARIYLLRKNDNVATGVTLTTIVLEKALDILVLLALLALLLPLMPLPAWAQRSGILMGAGLTGLMLVLVLAGHRTTMALQLTEAMLRFLPLERAQSIIYTQVGKGLAVLRLFCQSQRTLQVGLASAGIWLSTAVFVYILQAAFHLQAPWTAAIFVVCATNLGMAVPSSPGYMGVYHYIVVQSLALFNVDREAALSYGVVLHLFGFLPVSLLGLWFAVRNSFSVGQWSRTVVHRDEDPSELLIAAQDESPGLVSPQESTNIRK